MGDQDDDMTIDHGLSWSSTSDSISVLLAHTLDVDAQGFGVWYYLDS